MKFTSSFFQLLFDSMHTAIVLLDKTLRVRYLNPAAESLLQVSASRYIGTELDHVFSEYGHTPEGVEKALKSEQTFTKRRTTLNLPTGDIVVDYTVTPIADADQGMLMEIDPLDRALQIRQEEMLVASQAVAQDMVRGLAHEIKNPLGGLRGAAQLLHKQLESADHKEYTDIIINEADRLRNLVDRLLGSYKSIQCQEINIHEVLEYVRKLVSVETPAIPILFDYDPSIPDLFADREQLLQVFLNLVRNAVQALGDIQQPRILLKTRIQRKFTIGHDQHPMVLRVEVIDNGNGIDPSLAETLFFPMVSGRPEGTGLGLSIAQSIVNRHKGLIKFENQSEQTVFSVYLPFGEQHGS